MDQSYYGINEPYLFAFVNDLTMQQWLISAHLAITRCELWEWLRECTLKIGSKEMELLQEEMEKDTVNRHHSCTSYVHVLRSMKYIAKKGYPQYECDYINNY